MQSMVAGALYDLRMQSEGHATPRPYPLPNEPSSSNKLLTWTADGPTELKDLLDSRPSLPANPPGALISKDQRTLLVQIVQVMPAALEQSLVSAIDLLTCLQAFQKLQA